MASLEEDEVEQLRRKLPRQAPRSATSGPDSVGVSAADLLGNDDIDELVDGALSALADEDIVELDGGALAASHEAPENDQGNTRIMRGEICQLGESELLMSLTGGRTARIAYERIEAVAVGQVNDEDGAPEVLADLVLSPKAGAPVGLQLVRIAARDLDSPTGIEAGSAGPVSLKAALLEILDQSGAKPIPNPDAIAGFMVPTFESSQAFAEDLAKKLDRSLSN